MVGGKAIIGQSLLKTPLCHLPVAQPAQCIEYLSVPIGVGMADNDMDADGSGSNAADGLRNRLTEITAQQKIAGQRAAKGQLGKNDQIGAQLVARANGERCNAFGIAGNIAGVEIILGQRYGKHGKLPGLMTGRNPGRDRKSTRLNSSHVAISYAVFCLKKKK